MTNNSRFESRHYKTRVHAAKAYARRVGAHGYKGSGGWIYDANNNTIAQGWEAYAQRLWHQGVITQHMDGYWLVATAFAAGDEVGVTT